ncbi:asparaginase [Oligella ureolytica]
MTALDWAEQQVAEGAVGVILTQGTDTLEESAFLLDLLWRHEEPLILMGAMRGAAAVGADGPANLLNSIQVAVSANSRNRGVLVVMNEQIHYAALSPKKKHSLSLCRFCFQTSVLQELLLNLSLYFSQAAQSA